METAIEAIKIFLVSLSLAVPVTPNIDTGITEYSTQILGEYLEVEDLSETYGLIPYEEEAIEDTFRDVRFTNYYVGDGTGSGATVSVGLTTNNFQVNSRGWYTYKGRVVLATATTLCLEVKSGPCGRYNSLPNGYKANDLWDEVDIEFEGEIYPAVVLDSCGACFWDESKQRVDIFVTNQGRFGNRHGGMND